MRNLKNRDQIISQVNKIYKSKQLLNKAREKKRSLFFLDQSSRHAGGEKIQ